MRDCFEVIDRRVARGMGEENARMGSFPTCAEAEEFAKDCKFIGSEGYYIKEYIYEGPPEEVEKYYWADKCWRERREEHELTFSRREGK